MLEDGILTAPQQLLNTLSLQLPTDLSLHDMVNVYGGVTSQQRQMVKTGECNYVGLGSGEKYHISVFLSMPYKYLLTNHCLSIWG